MKVIQNIKNSNWFKENKRYFFWILMINLLLNGVIFTTVLINEYSFWEWFTDVKILISTTDLFLIPILAVLGMYLGRILGNTNGKSSRYLLFRTLGMLVGVWLGTSIIELWSYLVGIVDNDNIALGEFEFSPVTTNFIENSILALLIGFPIIYKDVLQEKIELRLAEKEQELERVYKMKVESELAAIHAKINPHFLYNSLNSIVSLIHLDPDRAEKMVLSLSDLFRYSINSSETHFAQICDEVRLIKTYLEIEHVRFADQLSYSIHVDPDILHEEIPKFLIQPLVENAIKHGTSNIPEGIIEIDIHKTDHWINISVYDNGPAFPELLDSGYGLKSTVSKLDLLYKDNYRFSLDNHPKKKISIQLKTKQKV